MHPYKLDFWNKNYPDQLTMIERLLANLDKLSEAGRRNVAVEEFRGQVAAARASHERVASLRVDLKTEISRRKNLFRIARGGAANAASGVAMNVDFDPAGMLGAGLPLAASNQTSVGVPAAPTDFRGAPTLNIGEVKLRWKRPLRRCVFELQWHTDPAAPDTWPVLDTCTRQTYIIPNLPSGANMRFRVRAVNAHGHGPWSPPVCVRVR